MRLQAERTVRRNYTVEVRCVLIWKSWGFASTFWPSDDEQMSHPRGLSDSLSICQICHPPTPMRHAGRSNHPISPSSSAMKQNAAVYALLRFSARNAIHSLHQSQAECFWCLPASHRPSIHHAARSRELYGLALGRGAQQRRDCCHARSAPPALLQRPQSQGTGVPSLARLSLLFPAALSLLLLGWLLFTLTLSLGLSTGLTSLVLDVYFADNLAEKIPLLI